MTVPTHFRRNSEMPEVVVLHYADLPTTDVEVGPGYKYTRPLRTILDLIENMTWVGGRSNSMSSSAGR